MIDKLLITLFIGVLVNALIAKFSPKHVSEAFITIMWGQTLGIVVLITYQLLQRIFT